MMELLEGESLAKRIERGGFTTAEIVHIFTRRRRAAGAGGSAQPSSPGMHGPIAAQSSTARS
jgi:hypothetical protein